MVVCDISAFLAARLLASLLHTLATHSPVELVPENVPLQEGGELAEAFG